MYSCKLNVIDSVFCPDSLVHGIAFLTRIYSFTSHPVSNNPSMCMFHVPYLVPSGTVLVSCDHHTLDVLQKFLYGAAWGPSKPPPWSAVSSQTLSSRYKWQDGVPQGSVSGPCPLRRPSVWRKSACSVLDSGAPVVASVAPDRENWVGWNSVPLVHSGMWGSVPLETSCCFHGTPGGHCL